MVMKRYFILVIIALNVIFSTALFAQFSSDVDGTLSVSDLGGGLSYIYPISNNSIDGFPIKVNLSYCDNMVLTSLKIFDKDSNNRAYWITNNKNQPSWVIGVNEFAVEVLGYRGSFVRDPSVCNFGMNRYIMEDQPSDYDMYMVDGYDFCNNLRDINKSDGHDAIKLLRANGSVLELRNGYTGSDPNSPERYTGRYYV